MKEDWRASAGFIEDLDWRRQLEQIAATQQLAGSLERQAAMRDEGSAGESEAEE